MFEHSQDPKGMSVDITVRLYEEADERGWLRCSVLSFLETSYFDSVFQHKPRYDCPAIELVAEWNDTIVGVIDVECEVTPGSVCTVCVDDNPSRLGGMIWHLAVHPDFQRRGIGGQLLAEAQRLASEHSVTCFEAWTRDDVGTLRWYESHGFDWVKHYLHVYIQGRDDVEGAIRSSIPGLKPQHVFAHYSGSEIESIRARFERVHDCNCFRLCF